MAKTKIPLASYILRRLQQHGCHHLHGVPGDYSLPFLSHLRSSGMKWIGSCNELNAGYAADGYARVKGLGALCTTYGVGELSAINAIAGSFAERVSVMNLVGVPRTETREKWEGEKDWGRKGRLDGLVHHALGRGEGLGVYEKMYGMVTAGQVYLGKEQASTGLFDRALANGLRERRPVYVQVPSDVAGFEVDEEGLETPLDVAGKSGEGTESVRRQIAATILQKLSNASRPVIFVDGIAARYQLEDEINQLIEAIQIPSIVTQHGLGIVESDQQNYMGVYAGAASDASLRDYVESSDLVLVFGPSFSDTNTAGWSAVPRHEVTVVLNGDSVEMDGTTHALDTKLLLQDILGPEQLKNLKTRAQSVPTRPSISTSSSPTNTQTDTSVITQDYLWPRLSQYFRSGDTILLANGTPVIGAALLNLPPKTKVISSGIWYSIGQMLPAAQGVALALQSLPAGSRGSGRTILLEGDGGFQTTAQELSTIIRYKLDVTIFLVNNEGYAYERLIQGPEAEYNDIAPWKYTMAPEMMGGVSTAEYPIEVHRVETTSELETLLEKGDFESGNGLKLVELVMGRLDVPKYYEPALRAAGERLGS